MTGIGASNGGSVERGLVYVVWGKAFVAEAVRSARSAKAHGGYPCAIITPDIEGLDDVFDYKISRPFNKTYADKIMMHDSPFEQTIFLDSDTVVTSSLDPLFALLDRFDVFFSAANGGNHYAVRDVPIASFPEFSAGVIGFRRNERVQRFFQLWQESYDEIERELGDGAWDQRSLRYAAWASDVRMTCLQHEWQCYTYFGNLLLEDAKIFHGRGKALEDLIVMANRHLDYRFVLPKVGYLPLSHTTTRQYARFTLSLMRMTAKRGIRRLLHHTGIWRLPINQRKM
jgi:hypothetical protein